MISSLHIENIAVVKRLDIDLSDGMTVLTGETGAGKSIIIDSLGLLLGARADKELIRSGEDTALVSAVFTELGDRAAERLSELGFEIEDRSVMLSRTVSRTSSSAKLNGRGITMSLLKEIGGLLFNIHGQNDNQEILDPKNHIRILDGYAGNEDLLDEYSGVYTEMLRIKREIEAIDSDSMERNRLSEMLRFQISDIDSAKLKIGEEEKLEELVMKLKGAEKISKSCNLVSKAVKGGEKNMGASYLVERAAAALESISDAIPEADGLVSRLYAIKYELEDIAEGMSALYDFGGDDPAKVAMSFGGASAGAGLIVPMLQRNFRIKEIDVQNGVDFTSAETTVYAHADIRIRIITILAIAVTAGIKTLKIFAARKKEAKASAAKPEAEKGR